MGIIANGRHASHPETLLLGGRDLVADPLGGHFPLKLRKGEQHVQGQTAHGRRGVKGLGDGDERTVGGLQSLNKFGEVRE